MAKDTADLVRKLDRVARATDHSARDGVQAAALASKDIMVAYAGRAGLRPGSKVAGRSWSVGFDVKGRHNPTALVRFRGPVHLVNNDTRPHYIGALLLGTGRTTIQRRAKRAGMIGAFGGSNRGAFGSFVLTRTDRRGTRARNGKKALSWSGAAHPAAYAAHPGTRGKKFFQRSLPASSKAAPLAYGRAWRRSLVKTGIGR